MTKPGSTDLKGLETGLIDGRDDVNDQTAYFGDTACDHLASILEADRPLRIFAVLDQQAYANSGAKDLLEQYFSGNTTTRFMDFEPNPKLDDVRKGIELYRQAEPELVVAVGGGTSIDMAKLIRALAGTVDPEAVIRGKSPIVASRSRFIAIPTTAGTGSEATQFAVVYIDGEKFSLDHASLRPAIAIVDPRLMNTLPAAVTAATGLDAFCQAIESIWAVGATDESVRYAQTAAALALAHLPQATNAPNSLSREAMSRASYLAGKAINISRTTASHALSYPLTSRYGIPHGIAVSLTLAPMLAYNAAVTDEDCVDVRGADHVQARIRLILDILGATSVLGGCARIQSLLAEIGCPTSLQEAGIASADELRDVIEAVNTQRLSNNPRKATSVSLFELLSPASIQNRPQKQTAAAL